MSSEPARQAAPAISLVGVGKTFYLFERPIDRLLLQFPRLAPRARVETFTGLHPLDLTVAPGEVVGLIGPNGAGKSTLLQLVCGTLSPSTGTINVNGKVAALLELGSGFNPEFTGRENVYMAGAIAGLSRQEIEARFEEILDFSGIGAFIDQPVKTYSSGMFVRLAFSVAVTVDPDILVVDEALSVGDGAFARKSFERIMALRDRGTTILFCSHNLYQIGAICNRALWLDQGQVIVKGVSAEVVNRYENHIYALEQHAQEQAAPAIDRAPSASTMPRLTALEIRLDEATANLTEKPEGTTGASDLVIEASWEGGAALSGPTLAITLHSGDGRVVGSAGSHIDGVELPYEAGFGQAQLRFPNLPLLEGEYWVEAYLLCDRGVMFYDQRIPAARFRMAAPARRLEQGVVHLAREWH